MWDEIYEQLYPELLKYCTRTCQDRELAADLAQEAFLRALQNADTFEDLGASQKRAWLYRTVKNLIYDRYRRAQTELAWLENQNQTEEYIDPGLQIVENELLLSILTPEDRALFHLRYVENYNASELADMFGIPPGTIRARLSRCRMLLKKQLREN